jgi:hypothetical protein
VPIICDPVIAAAPSEDVTKDIRPIAPVPPNLPRHNRRWKLTARLQQDSDDVTPYEDKSLITIK